MSLRVLFVGGTGPVGLSALPHVLEAGHSAAVAHSGAHEPAELPAVEHLHGQRERLLATGGPAERWAPDVLIDTFPGGATAGKAHELGRLAKRCGARRIVAVSSMDVYRHCALAGVDDHEPSVLPLDPLPLGENAPRRAERSPTGGQPHDNVAMEDALHGCGAVTILRPGAIYGPFLHPRVVREWFLVGKVARGERRLALPGGGTQLFHRVACDRVGRAVAASIDRAPDGHWACNVGDPRDFTFGALAALVAERLDWSWDAVEVAWQEGDHPWNVRHPVVTDTTRLRDVLGVTEPDPVAATCEQIDWLWEHRDAAARLPG